MPPEEYGPVIHKKNSKKLPNCKNRKTLKARKIENSSKEIVINTNQQVYGVITKVLGGSKVEVHCADNTTRTGRIRGKFRNKFFFRRSVIVLVALRDFQNSVCDVIPVYNIG